MAQELNIPQNWVAIKLSDLFLDPVRDIVDGPFGSNLKASEYKPSGIPILRIQNIDRFKFIDQKIQYVTVEKADFLDRHNYQPGDIIITKLGEPVGKACIVPDSFPSGIIVADLVRVRVNNLHANKKFLTYQLNSGHIIQQFEANTKGTTRQRVKLSVVRNLRFSIPPINEQNRIVNKLEELFSELDNGVENLKRAQNQLKVYRQVLLKQAFEGGLTEKWRIDNKPEPAEKLLKRIKEERQAQYEQRLKHWKSDIEIWKKTKKKGQKPVKPKKPQELTTLSQIEIIDLPQLPDSLIYTRLGNLCELISGQHILEKDYNNEERGVPYLTGPSDFGKVYPVFSRWTESPKVVANPKDLLITVKGSGVGKINVMKYKGAIGRQLMALRSYLENNWYLYYFLKYNNERIQKLSTGTAIPGIGRGDILDLICPLFSEEECNMNVQEIEKQFSIIDELESQVLDSINKEKTLRQSILKRAFEGKLVEQDLNDEPVSELLKRIQEEKRKYLKEQKQQKKKVPKRTKKMKKSLSEIIEKSFHDKEFSYDDLKVKCDLSYEEIKSQLFELIDSNEKLKSRFDQSLEEIKYSMSR